MPEVDVDAVHFTQELRKAIERGLVPSPVVLVTPVRAQLAHIGNIGAAFPGSAGQRLGIPRGVEAAVEIGEDVLGHIDTKGAWSHGFTVPYECREGRC